MHPRENWLFSRPVISTIIIGFTLLAFLPACQKELKGADPELAEDTTGVWVLKTREVQGFATSAGHPDYHNMASFIYDWTSRLIIVKDTNVDNQSDEYYIFRYNDEGKLINSSIEGKYVVKTERSLTYNSTGLPDRIDYKETTIMVFTHTGVFSWAQKGGGMTASFLDPNMQGGIYSQGNRSFELNGRQQLVNWTAVSGDPLYGDQLTELVRDAGQNVSVRKLSVKKSGGYQLRDSVLYMRETLYPPRISQFYKLMGNGIAWFTNTSGIEFLPTLDYNSEFFEYENNLAKKVVYYLKGTDANGNPVERIDKVVDLVTEYDNNRNPVKLTIFRDGEKEVEIKLGWRRVKWLQ